MFALGDVGSAELEDYYRGEFWDSREDLRDNRSVHYQSRALARLQRRFVFDVAQKAGSRFGDLGAARVLEIGCGYGHLLKEFADAGAEVEGLEPDSEKVRFARERLGLSGVEQGFLGEAALGGASYDLVLMSHVLEHLADPVRGLTQLRDLLRPGGRLFLEVPHDSPEKVELMMELGTTSSHLWFFVPRALREVALRAGFQVDVVATAGYPLTRVVRDLRFDVARRRDSLLFAVGDDPRVLLGRKVAARMRHFFGLPANTIYSERLPWGMDDRGCAIRLFGRPAEQQGSAGAG